MRQFLAAAALVVLPCFLRPADGADPRIGVVASFSVVGDWVREVGGTNIAVTVLVGPDGDAHTFEPAPSDSVAIHRARVVFSAGAGFDSWIADIIRASRCPGEHVVLGEGLATLEAAHPGCEGGHGHERDPHFWQDVSKAKAAVERISKVLSRTDPGGSETYAANASRYLSELEELDVWIRVRAGEIPAANRKLFTTHNTLGYFASAYGFEIAGSGLGSLTTEDADPSARDMAEAIRRIRGGGIRAVFTENMHGPSLARQIASAGGVRLAGPLYTDALGGPGSGGATYVEMMRHNVSVIAEALKP